MEEIIAYLNNQIIDSDDINPRLWFTLQFYEDYFKAHPEDELASYKVYDRMEFLGLFLVRHKPEKLFDVQKYLSYYDTLFAKLKVDAFSIIYIVLLSPIFREIYNFKNNVSFLDRIMDVQKLSVIEDVNGVTVSTILSKIICNDEFIQESWSLLQDLNFTLKDARLFNRYYNLIEGLSCFLRRNRDCQLLRDFLAKDKTNDDIKVVIQSIYSDYLNAKRMYLKEVSRTNKENGYIKKVIEIIKENPVYMPINVLKKIMALPISEEIKQKVLDYAAVINANAESEKQKEYDIVQNSQEKVMARLLAQFGIDYESLNEAEKQSVLDLSKEDLEAMLTFFSKYKIAYSSVEVFVLYDVQKIKIVNTYIERGILTESFIRANLIVLQKGNDLISLVNNNIDRLYRLGINVTNYTDDLSILLYDISSSIDLLASYNIKVSKKVHRISFLASDNLKEKIDLVIEMGLDLANDLDILNDDLKVIYKKGIANKLNIDYYEGYFNVCDTEDLMPNTSLLIPDDILEKLKNASGYCEIPEILNAYAFGDMALNINGIIISRNRFMRNLSAIDITSEEEVYYAALYGGYYTIDECMVLKNVIAPSLEGALKRNKKTED